MKSIALGLMLTGALLFVAGGALWLAARFNIPLGRLPGDFHWQGKGWSVSVPLMTSILLSIILTILLSLFLRR